MNKFLRARMNEGVVVLVPFTFGGIHSAALEVKKRALVSARIFFVVQTNCSLHCLCL